MYRVPAHTGVGLISCVAIDNQPICRTPQSTLSTSTVQIMTELLILKMISGRQKTHSQGPKEVHCSRAGEGGGRLGQSGHRRHGEKRIDALRASEWALAGLCPGQDGREEERTHG